MRPSAPTLAVLTYHRVGEPRHSPPGLVSATPATFERQMRLLARTGRAVGLDDVLRSRNGTRELPRGAVLVTFDDAYRDFREHAWPVARRLHIPVVLFVPTAFPASGRAFWWDRLFGALDRARGEVDTPLGRAASADIRAAPQGVPRAACSRQDASPRPRDGARRRARGNARPRAVASPRPVLARAARACARGRRARGALAHASAPLAREREPRRGGDPRIGRGSAPRDRSRPHGVRVPRRRRAAQRPPCSAGRGHRARVHHRAARERSRRFRLAGARAHERRAAHGGAGAGRSGSPRPDAPRRSRPRGAARPRAWPT